MKAQSAIEYLITYGWMLIALSIVSAAIFGIYEPVCSESASGFIGQTVSIENFGVNSDDELQVVLRNNENYDVDVSRIVLEDGEDIRQIYDPATIEPGSTNILSAQEVDQQTSECTTYDVEIRYDIETLENQRVSGSLTTATDFPDINAPSSPENPELTLS